ncbi:HAD family hydrolase [Hufsiella ginkgonis]|uniref:phosphoglycolate phosphatase n=1 Tax=Hufsiella ginkgonis TaxID=2695274 RepID=A0A7K1Y3G7_9SPHI|nr:HAD family hydrolase [Hufsiella ginkgonis]MXV17417.1 HAD-IA family hydrolase [Hufsiella ginkgonis]
MIKNIFFDFDGVLAESVNVKTEAFRNLYRHAGDDIADKVVEYHLANGGVSRYDKIRYYHKEFLKLDISDDEVNEWAGRFSDLALDGVVNAPQVAGAVDFLSAYHKKYRCWIITGTPTGEIRPILRQRNWNGYFEDAYGSPEKKYHWTEYIINKENLKRSETVFVGDAKADQEAAERSGLVFILRRTEENAHLFADYNGFEINDMLDLPRVLTEIELVTDK